MSLDVLPNELVLIIAQCFRTQKQISRLARTNRRLYALLNPYLYTRNVKDTKSSALIWAVHKGELQTAIHSLKRGADVKSRMRMKGIDYMAPLTLAVYQGHDEMTRLLLEHGASPNIDHSNMPPLAHAVTKGNQEISRLLLEHGANPNEKLYSGTLLYRAVEEGYAEIVRLLLEHGATPNVKCKYTPLALAVDKGNKDIVKLLLEHGANLNGRHRHKTLLCTAVETGDKEITRLFLEHGANPNKLSYCWPLNCAVERGHEEIVRVLLEHGAKPNAKHNGRHTNQAPLWTAVRKDNYSMAKILLENGANPDYVNADQTTPLFIAAALGSITMTEVLLQHGADPDHEAGSGQTPLCAAVLPCKEVATIRGYGPLHGQKHTDTGGVIKILLHHGACPWKPLISALKKKYPSQEDQSKLLLQYAADPGKFGALCEGPAAHGGYLAMLMGHGFWDQSHN